MSTQQLISSLTSVVNSYQQLVTLRLDSLDFSGLSAVESVDLWSYEDTFLLRSYRDSLTKVFDLARESRSLFTDSFGLPCEVSYDDLRDFIEPYSSQLLLILESSLASLKDKQGSFKADLPEFGSSDTDFISSSHASLIADISGLGELFFFDSGYIVDGSPAVLSIVDQLGGVFYKYYLSLVSYVPLPGISYSVPV